MIVTSFVALDFDEFKQFICGKKDLFTKTFTILVQVVVNHKFRP